MISGTSAAAPVSKMYLGAPCLAWGLSLQITGDSGRDVARRQNIDVGVLHLGLPIKSGYLGLRKRLTFK